ncbi:MAG TPA: hypothetical protein VF792_04535 [Ktedonobacterales bacterium]
MARDGKSLETSGDTPTVSPLVSAPRDTTRWSEQTRAIVLGLAAGLGLTILIALGSRGFHWFDSALIGYAVATIFCVAAVTYKYTFWLMRPPTGRYFWRSWQLFLSFERFRHYTSLIPRSILDLFLQRFIRKRSIYRWVMHQCIFWGVVLSCAITFPLTFGWLRFTQPSTRPQTYSVWIVGFPAISFPPDSVFAWVLFHALDLTALLLFVGLVMAFHRRFHDLAAIAIQRFRFDIVPLALLMAIVISGLALTADSSWFHGAYYTYISLTHEAIVVLWLISLPFGKFFHIIERPATVGIELYWRTGADEEKHTCPRCGSPFLPARFIADLKQTLHAVGEDYCVPPPTMGPAEFARLPEAKLPTSVTWWQDFCPECKRVMRAEATLGALGAGGNRFL